MFKREKNNMIFGILLFIFAILTKNKTCNLDFELNALAILSFIEIIAELRILNSFLIN